MEIFIALLFKLIPLYVIIFLGFIAGKYLLVKKESFATLLIYIIAPVIVFNGVVTTTLNINSLSLPILFFIICSVISITFYFIAKTLWKDSTKNILAFTAGTGNTGYFGIPVAVALFDSNVLGLVVLSLLGFLLYENTVGFFITAKGQQTAHEALMKVVRLPTLYAFIFGLLINLLALQLGSIYNEAVNNFRGAYVILGMMLIGMGLSGITNLKFDFKFIGLTFLAKFIIWPLVVLAIIIADNLMLNLYDTTIERVMILMAIVPLAANTVAYATKLNAQPEKASVAVLLSTLFALFYIPLIASYYLK